MEPAYKMSLKQREYYQRYFKSHRREKRKIALAWYKKLRLNVLSRLGAKCAHCGFNDQRALQVDHIDGGGYAERKVIGQTRILTSLLKMERPELKYQILCANCNWIKRAENFENKSPLP